MRSFLGLCSLAVALMTGSAWASGIQFEHRQLVVNEVVRAYSTARYAISGRDIWALAYDRNQDPACVALVTGLAKRPGRFGSSTYQFWVCISKTVSGRLEAEMTDEVQVADE